MSSSLNLPSFPLPMGKRIPEPSSSQCPVVNLGDSRSSSVLFVFDDFYFTFVYDRIISLDE